MKYNELAAQLDLNADVSTTEKLKRLERWWLDNISRDIQFMGNSADAYENYQNIASFFLDEVLPVISKNISEHYQELDGLTPIQFAASAGFDQWILDLTPNSTDVNAPNQYLMTPLHMAATDGYYHTVKALCDLGANPKAENKNKQLPIFSALMLPIDGDEDLKERKLKIFKYLKTKAPETLKHQDKSGNTVLHLIATYGYSSLIEDVLYSVPELFAVKNNHNRYPIHTAILDNQIECVRPFISMPNIEQLSDASGETALHYAARFSSKEMIALCSTAFETIDIPDDTGKTPLMAAAQTGNIETMKALLAEGADATLTDHDGNSLLHYAAYYNLTGPTEWILNNISSIEINAQNHSGQTALNICEERKDEDKSNLLKKHGATNGKTFSG